MTINVLSGGSFKPGIPKGVLQGGVWKEPKKVWTLQGGVWKLAWEPAPDAPPYLYSVEIEYLPNYEVKFTVLDGWPEGDPNEMYTFHCVQIPRDGYVGRVFNKIFSPSGYSALDCTLEDLSSIQGKERRKIEFKITPRP